MSNLTVMEQNWKADDRPKCAPKNLCESSLTLSHAAQSKASERPWKKSA